MHETQVLAVFSDSREPPSVGRVSYMKPLPGVPISIWVKIVVVVVI